MRKKYAEKLDLTAFLKIIRETPYTRTTQPIYYETEVNGFELFLQVERHETISEEFESYVNEYLLNVYFLKPQDKLSLKNINFGFSLKFYDRHIIENLWTTETVAKFLGTLTEYQNKMKELEYKIEQIS